MISAFREATRDRRTAGFKTIAQFEFENSKR